MDDVTTGTRIFNHAGMAGRLAIAGHPRLQTEEGLHAVGEHLLTMAGRHIAPLIEAEVMLEYLLEQRAGDPGHVHAGRLVALSFVKHARTAFEHIEDAAFADEALAE